MKNLLTNIGNILLVTINIAMIQTAFYCIMYLIY